MFVITENIMKRPV